MSRLRSRMLMMEPRATSVAVPLTIANLAGWWDFSDATKLYTDAGTTLVSADADPIYRCADKSGNSRHLNQSTSGSRPLYKTGIQNSLSVARFDGTDDQMRSASFAYNQPNTIYLVVKSAVSDAFAYYFSSLAAFGCAMFNNTGAGAGCFTMYAGSSGPQWNGATAAGFQVLSLLYNTTASKMYRNGPESTDGSADAGSQNGDGIVIGDRYLDDKPHACDFGELLIYNAAHDASTRSTLTTYLGTKWNITIS